MFSNACQLKINFIKSSNVQLFFIVDVYDTVDISAKYMRLDLDNEFCCK